MGSAFAGDQADRGTSARGEVRELGGRPLARRTDFLKNGHLLPADLIADIYEAAIDDQRWPAISEIVAAAAGFDSGGVWFTEHGEVRDLSLTADILAMQGPYLAHYFKQDLWAQGHLKSRWEQVHIGYELCSEGELVKTEFYNDFARPNGIFRPMGVMMRLGRGTYATVSLNQPGSKELLQESDKPRLQRLVPHLRRALQLRLAQGKHAPRAPIHAAVLDSLAFGVVVCDAAGHIVLANKAAEAMAKAGAGITLGDRRKGFGAVMSADAKAFAVLVHDAANGGPGGVMRVTGRGGCAELVALVTPLPRSLAHNGSAGPTYALVTLRSAWDSPSFSAETLIALFGLSPAQAAIALAIFDGKSPEAITAERGVTIATLRTHLTAIFARTGADNQRDLVRLLATLPPVRTRSDATDRQHRSRGYS
jgi:DNA-binding CsgD family transcriptional regulator/PAS domain-containing protein